MPYSVTPWLNNSVPAMNATNLNKLKNELASQAASQSIAHSLPTWVNGAAPALSDPAPLNEMERVAAAVAAVLGLSYTVTVWQDGWVPARNAANLNKLEAQANANRAVIDNPPVPAGVLRWTPPGYPSYTGYTTINLNAGGSNRFQDLAPGNYIINVGDYQFTEGPSIIPDGGNVVIIGGRITIDPSATVNPFGLALWPRNGATIYIEGLQIRPGTTQDQHLHDGIVMRHNGTYPSTSASRVILQNMRVGPNSIKLGYVPGEHSDNIQWQSDFPGQVWIDMYTGVSDYSGFMTSNFDTGLNDLHRVNLRGQDVNPAYSFADGAALYQGIAATPFAFDDVWIQPTPPDTLASCIYPSTSGRNVAPTDSVSVGTVATDATSQYISWANSASGLAGKIRNGIPAAGDFVPVRSTAGGYVSPGYQAGSAVVVPGPISGQGYSLVFEDDFDTFDTATWIRAAWQGYQTTPAIDASVSGSILSISSRRTDGYPNHNISTRLGAVGSPTTGETWQNGYFEMRSRWPAGKGSWPAFWLFSEHWVATSSVPPYVAEIDILEAAGGLYLDKYNHVVHSNTSGAGGVGDVFAPTGAGQFASPNIGNLTTGFHTYACKWTTTTVSFYCDDIFLASTPTVANSTNQPLFMILSMWVGKAGDWVGAYDGTTPNVLTHEIDWVRVWQQ